MRVFILLCWVFYSGVSSLAQTPSPWTRVYTFDDSVIEMDAASVIVGGDIARARFRWTFDSPQRVAAGSRETYKHRFETFEFNCKDKRYRIYDYELRDETGRQVSQSAGNKPGPWREVSFATMIERLFIPACETFKQETQPASTKIETDEQLHLGRFVLAFWEELEKSKDFKTLVRKFFAADYLNRYLTDQQTNWFFNVHRDTIAKASRDDLERFYVALMNTSYLGSMYFLSQHHHMAKLSLPESSLVPAEMLEIVDAHPYTARYRNGRQGYDYLNERIDSVEKLQSYTDLLEKISLSLRNRVNNLEARDLNEYHKVLCESEANTYCPLVELCGTECLGTPVGTKVFEVTLSVFRLRIAKVKGSLKVISAAVTGQ